MRKILFVSLLAFSVLLSSCDDHSNNKQTTASKDSLVIKPLSPEKIDSINDAISPQIEMFVSDTSKQTEKIFGLGKGKLWRVWAKLFKDCENNSLTQGMEFYGISNTLGIGTIVDVVNNNKTLAAYAMVQDSFSAGERKMMFNFGVDASCEYSKSSKTKVSADFLIKSKVNSDNATLDAVIQSSKDIYVKIESFKQNNFYVDGASTVLKSKSSTFVDGYKSSLANPDRYIVTRELLITGMSMIITTKTNISADLKAQLTSPEGVSGKIGDATGNLNFSYVDATTIKATTKDPFVVFVDLTPATIIKK